ncbi:DUF7344 domain-containing protein [Halosimplex halophilum]|uniref:DUF7344 domain-containing protein n=1 Tax=Halosimplex halophilum TaxID=2559572 RepID=UPI00107FBD18|nr:hypothetical protein [Halosimplex halophilum]
MVGTNLDADTVIDLCRDRDRRIVLAVLADRGQPETLDALAEAVVEHNDDIATGPSDETVARIKTSLYHCHVPKLVDAGLVTFDADRKLVEPNEGIERIERHLASVASFERTLSASASR